MLQALISCPLNHPHNRESADDQQLINTFNPLSYSNLLNQSACCLLGPK